MNNLDYGVIGNCRTAALVSKTGSIEWFCLPEFDGPAVFSRILDTQKGGQFGFSVPDGSTFAQEYLPETNILRTRVTTADGSFEVLDFMPRHKITPVEYYTPPEIYRLFRPLSGKPRLSIQYTPVMNYARENVIHKKYKEYICSASEKNDNDTLYLYSKICFDSIIEGCSFVLERDEFILLSYHQKLIPIDFDCAMLELERTKVYWMNWLNRSIRFEKYDDMVARSLLVLKLMVVERTGAILAALTTSIPESIGTERTWDYRYCWLRDASMSITTLLRMGHRNTARRFLRFIKRIVKSKQDSFQIMYGIRGERTLTEETLDHLAGYENSRPVRIGNAAYNQKQNDSLGYLLDVIYTYYRVFPGTLDDIEEMWELVRKVVSTVITEWELPDQSIWEFRNKKEHFVFSKVMCWVALDRAARIAALLGFKEIEKHIHLQAETIREDVFTKGWNDEIQSFSQSYGSAEVDASLLLMEQYGFIAVDDERYVKTVNRVKEELFHNGLMYRYRQSDDFGQPESAFTICSFWLVRALHVTGRQKEAVALFEEITGYSNHVGLFSEDLDFATKRQLGNFPQAYSHLALIDVVALITQKTPGSEFIRP